MLGGYDRTKGRSDQGMNVLVWLMLVDGLIDIVVVAGWVGDPISL